MIPSHVYCELQEHAVRHCMYICNNVTNTNAPAVDRITSFIKLEHSHTDSAVQQTCTAWKPPRWTSHLVTKATVKLVCVMIGFILFILISFYTVVRTTFIKQQWCYGWIQGSFVWTPLSLHLYINNHHCVGSLIWQEHWRVVSCECRAITTGCIQRPCGCDKSSKHLQVFP